MKVSREDLLQELETVKPGLSSREVLDQSSCFCFQGGEVFTFNGEIACRYKTKLKLTGAVKATPLLELLRRLPEDEIEIRTKDSELLVKGKRRKAWLSMEEEIGLPIDEIEKPKKWNPLPEEFGDAVNIVHHCAGKDQTKEHLTCVNIHPKWIEATDNFQASRYKLKTGLDSPVLVKKESIKHITSMAMKEFSLSRGWIHFRNEAKLVVSCAMYEEEFPNISGLLKVSGTRIKLPKNMVEAVERAEIFSSENPDDNLVTIDIRPGEMRVIGKGVPGRYIEPKKIKYDGEPLKFMIPPKLIGDITSMNSECEITDSRLKVNGGAWVYVTALGEVDDG